MEITISGKDKKSIQKVEALAKRLGLQVQNPLSKEKEETKNNSEELYKLMEEMATSGGITSIKDPVKWQREVRKDKKLYGRV
ncbi:hypothetical protein LB456_01960 [Psychroflexus sp. CAK57W]|uniref:hypothetical protein n=1 Tax=Psychroflexus curvus TaxID=2873595 RepID=UPI001CCEE3A3|nr:hypothetical protein [Psychroflexus curvus]MBZ9627725.1 hypothetical protein [Psychroflexus curvus]MBZ9786212.1 hypothetical protein [Psychroflexus curvus]